MKMSHMSKQECIAALRERYLKAEKEEKRSILNEFCLTTGYHRKSAIRVMREPEIEEFKRRVCKESRGRKSKYRDPEFVKALKGLWFETNQLCPVNFKQAIPLWLNHFEKENEISADTKAKLLKISSATISRVLEASRYRTKRNGTTPGTLLRTQIPIRTNFWDVTIPGFMEADTVAHCGGSMSGEFVWSLTVTDIATTWTELRPIWSKLSVSIRDAIIDINEGLPFKIKAFDSDNGSEFINHTLVNYFSEKLIAFTRSREYQKNDNAYVEQKNWTHVRGLLGYDRIDLLEVVPLLYDVLKNEVSLLNNHFMPCLKLEAKERRQSKIYRKYDDPKTPYQRVLLAQSIDQKTKDDLTKKHNTLNPMELKSTINAKLKLIFKMVREAKIPATIET